MTVKIKYYYINNGDSMFAIPSFHHEEIVRVEDVEKLREYITAQKDESGAFFKRKESFGFDYISSNGAVKTETVKIKTIK